MAKKKAGGKNKKHGRNKVQCAAYKARGQREKNKAKKMAKHIAAHPGDSAAAHKIKNLRPRVKG